MYYGRYAQAMEMPLPTPTLLELAHIISGRGASEPDRYFRLKEGVVQIDKPPPPLVVGEAGVASILFDNGEVYEVGVTSALRMTGSYESEDGDDRQIMTIIWVPSRAVREHCICVYCQPSLRI